MTALFVLAADFRDAAEKLSDLDLDTQTVADTLEGLAGEVEEKAVNVAAFVRNLEATADAIKSAEADMAERRKRIETRAAALRAYLQRCMEMTGISKIESPYFRLTIRANPPSVDVFDPAQIPAEYMRTPPPPPTVPDKPAIKAALQAGTDVPGAKLRADIKRLEIK